ncbi:hypothetical protein [Algoriphagus pacificus]|uniref:Uncharacterized protein n=1 Tax=Algoriphagus pacificus TaxID=2811234 RepID=A0ABS3CAR4_9BACT|nr:hypothetical protein [Algoriphagus pacificus]MBN7814197.1 hypothetical protein [Algoriphagus pacificus]
MTKNQELEQCRKALKSFRIIGNDSGKTGKSNRTTASFFRECLTTITTI